MLRVLILLGLLYSIYAGYYWVMQRRIIYPTALLPPVPTIPEGPGMEIIPLATSAGRVPSILLHPVPERADTPAPAILIAHGNLELIQQWVPAVQALREAGWAVYLIEYPGYGHAAGRPSQRSITEAFVTGYDTLVARPDIDAGRIVFMGRSLGSGAVCALAACRPSSALVLMSGFTSVADFALRMGLPPFLVRDPYNNRSVLQQYPGPVLILHGRRDREIPFSHAQQLAAAAPRARLIPLPCGHNDCVTDWPSFWHTRILPFLEETVPCNSVSEKKK